MGSGFSRARRCASAPEPASEPGPEPERAVVAGRRTGIILPVVDVSVHHAVIVAVGPDRAGKTADRSADHRALEDADARKDRTGRRAERRAAERARRRTGEDAVGLRIIALRRAGIILAVVHIAVDIAVIVVVGPRRAGETADRRADRGALDHADARNHRADGGAADCADRRVLRDRADWSRTRRAWRCFQASGLEWISASLFLPFY